MSLDEIQHSYNLSRDTDDYNKIVLPTTASGYFYNTRLSMLLALTKISNFYSRIRGYIEQDNY